MTLLVVEFLSLSLCFQKSRVPLVPSEVSLGRQAQSLCTSQSTFALLPLLREFAQRGKQLSSFSSYGEDEMQSSGLQDLSLETICKHKVNVQEPPSACFVLLRVDHEATQRREFTCLVFFLFFLKLRFLLESSECFGGNTESPVFPIQLSVLFFPCLFFFLKLIDIDLLALRLLRWSSESQPLMSLHSRGKFQIHLANSSNNSSFVLLTSSTTFYSLQTNPGLRQNCPKSSSIPIGSP